ncbi:hypothetical protein K1719_043832 [Acacia pycnantha]|nr:hypothetical protein K1719_043832 [Acacia pycnantha]
MRKKRSEVGNQILNGGSGDTHVQYHEGYLHGDIDTNLPHTFASSYLDEGDANYECQFCGANMWFSERLKRLKKSERPQFNICCCHGKITVPLQDPPEELRQNHHFIGSLLPPEGNPPVYAQLYIYDTDNEVSNRISTVRSAAEIIKHDVVHDVNIRLIRNGNSSGLDKKYNVPTTSELAALIVGDFDNSYTNRDIIVKRQCGALQRIDELHMAYLPLQYPLFFHYGDNGYDSSM